MRSRAATAVIASSSASCGCLRPVIMYDRRQALAAASSGSPECSAANMARSAAAQARNGSPTRLSSAAAVS